MTNLTTTLPSSSKRFPPQSNGAIESRGIKCRFPLAQNAYAVLYSSSTLGIIPQLDPNR